MNESHIPEGPQNNLLKPGFHIVIIVVIRSAIIVDQVLQQLRVMETRVVIVVILSAISRQLLKELNQVQLLQQLQQSPTSQHLMETFVAGCLRWKSAYATTVTEYFIYYAMMSQT